MSGDTPALRSLLGPLPPEDFARRHWTQEPYAAPGAASAWSSRCGWDVVARLLEETPCDVVVARAGALRDGAGEPARPRTLAEAQALLGDGWSLALRRAHLHDPVLAELAQLVAEAFHGAINLQLYCSPPDGSSFGWHYDAEDVFTVMCAGTKRYRLRRNTVHPEPVPESMPRDMAWERERSPGVECTLAPGDLLYIPGGWWHDARGDSACLSIGVGVMAETPLELLEFVRRRLAQTRIWRRRLPSTGDTTSRDPEDARREWAEAAAALADEAARQLREPATIDDFVAAKRAAAHQVPPIR